MARPPRLSACEPGGAPFVCDRCGAKGFNFDLHKCAGMRELSKLPFDILRQLARKEIDEAEAWRLADARAAEGPLDAPRAIAALEKLGLGEWSTGGGCTALALELRDGRTILVTDGDDGTGQPTPQSASLMVGLQDADGAEIWCHTLDFDAAVARVHATLPAAEKPA